MLRGLAGMPLVTPIVGADSRVQVVGADDLAATVALCLGPRAYAKATWDLAHPQVHPLAGVVAATQPSL